MQMTEYDGDSAIDAASKEAFVYGCMKHGISREATNAKKKKWLYSI